MKRSVTVLFLSIFLLAGCSEERGATHSTSVYMAENAASQEAFRSKIKEFMDDHGFTEANDPGGLASWSGVHAPGESVQWYRGSYHGAPQFLVSIQELPTGTDKSQFNFSVSWHVVGSEDEIQEVEDAVAEFLGTAKAFGTDFKAEQAAPD